MGTTQSVSPSVKEQFSGGHQCHAGASLRDAKQSQEIRTLLEENLDDLRDTFRYPLHVFTDSNLNRGEQCGESQPRSRKAATITAPFQAA